MNIKIIGVGKVKEKYFKAGIAEYAKRMERYAKFEIVEVPDEKAPRDPQSGRNGRRDGKGG